MGLLDRDSEEPQSKLRRYIILGLIGVLVLTAVILYATRYNAEKETVATFLDTVVRGDTQTAFRMWEQRPSYAYKDFLDDWGPSGYYGPVKSYQIVTAQQRRGSPGITIVVEVSPFSPFPSDSEREKLRQNKEVRFWVNSSTQALSFAP